MTTKDKQQPEGAQDQRSLAASFIQGGGQNAALEWLVKNKKTVLIFLITGVKFEGVITGFDQYTICITDIRRHQQLIYKDKISTMVLKEREEG